LYAQTKELFVNLFEVPANCNNDFCVSYKFIDKDIFDYSTDDFFAIKDNVYALEATFFSFKNRDVSLESLTSTTNPILSFISIDNKLQFPENINLEAISEFDVSLGNISLNAGVKQKYYIFFIAKQLGNTYINTKITGPTISTFEDKFNFNISPEKQMIVELDPNSILSYNSKLKINIKDATTNNAIENAFIKISNEHDQFISSVKGNNLNGKNGLYIVSHDFVSNKLKLDISAYGYRKVNKEILVAELDVLKAPNTITINIGEKQTTGTTSVVLRNSSSQPITGLTYEYEFLRKVNSLDLSAELLYEIQENSSEAINFVASVDADSEFTSAKANVTIFGYIGNKQVAKKIDVLITRGKVVEDCLKITPLEIDFFIGEVKDAENTQTIYLENKCQKSIDLSPELAKKVSSDELEINIPAFTINSGETKEYDIVIKNNKLRKTNKIYNYEIFWDNPEYVFNSTKLNISFFNLDSALYVQPLMTYIPISQTSSQNPAIINNIFIVTNRSNVPVRDLQISHYTPELNSNLQPQFFPPTKELLRPGDSLSIRVEYKGSLNDASIDQMVFRISGFAPGNNTEVSTNVRNIFLMSGSNCLKIKPKNLNFDMIIGQIQEKIITVTNNCAEPVNIVGFDKKNAHYLQTFGNNKVELIPLSSNPLIPIGTSKSFSLKISASDYYESIKSPLMIYGTTNLGAVVDSENILFSVNIKSPLEEENQELMQVYDDYVPVCGDEDEEINIKIPIISENCEDDGYCEAYDAAQLILKKINELQSRVLSASSQVENLIERTECSANITNKNYCEINEINPSIKPIELDIYLKNDVVTTDLLKQILKEDYNSKNKKFDYINNYMVTVNPSTSTYGINFAGNTINMPSFLAGCGRYKVKINGVVAASYDKLVPSKAYYYVDVSDPIFTMACLKEYIPNFLVYLPLNKELDVRTSYTWMTKFTGEQQLGEKFAKTIFNTKNAYVSSTSNSYRTNNLDISIGQILENKDALAKITFKNPKGTKIEPQQINMVINSEFKVGDKLSDDFLEESSKIISTIFNKNEFADICISKDRSYMLVLSLLSIGELEFNTIDNKKEIEIKENKFCKEFKIKSNIEEKILINTKTQENIDVSYIYKGSEQSKLDLLLNANKEEKFNVCFTPKTAVLNDLVGSEVEVTAISKYRDKGKLGQRQITRNLELTSCGITPVELLEKIKVATGNIISDSSVDKEYYALLNWDKSYNAIDREEFCTTMEKYLNTLNKKEIGNNIFYTKITECDLDGSTAYKEAVNSKAKTNFGYYSFACFTTCAGCSGVANIALTLTGIGAGKWLLDVLLDCGLGCLIPAATYFAGATVDTENPKGLFAFFIKGIGDTANFFGKVLEDATSKIVGGITSVFAGGWQAISQAKHLTNAAATYTSPTIGVPFNNVPGTTTNIKSTTTQLNNYRNYLLGTGSHTFVPDVADATSLNNIKTKLTRGSISNLDAVDRIALADIMERGTFTKVKGGFGINKNAFITKIRNSVTGKYYTLDPIYITQLTTQMDDLKTSSSNLDDMITNLKSVKKSNNAQIKLLQDQKSYIDDLITKGDDILKAPAKIPSSLHDDFADGITKLSKNKIKVGGASRFVAGAAGFAKGLVCTLLGNMAGASNVKINNKEGNVVLQNSISFENSINSFEKNQTYKIIFNVKEDEDNSSKKNIVINLIKDYPKNKDSKRFDSCIIKN
jgi:hypothetical protein